MKNIIEFVKKEMLTKNGHGFDHAKRVFELCKKILKKVKANEKVVLTAAFLHDVVDHKFFPNPEGQYKKIRKLLASEKYSSDEIEKIEWLIGNTSFSKNRDLSDNIDAQILSDADKLDAIGAIGIIRAIQFNKARNFAFERDFDELRYFAELYKKHDDLVEATRDMEENKGNEYPIYHIHRKFFRITERLYTDFAKKEAKKRIKFLLVFLKEYYEENFLL